MAGIVILAAGLPTGSGSPTDIPTGPEEIVEWVLGEVEELGCAGWWEVGVDLSSPLPITGYFEAFDAVEYGIGVGLANSVDDSGGLPTYDSFVLFGGFTDIAYCPGNMNDQDAMNRLIEFWGSAAAVHALLSH